MISSIKSAHIQQRFMVKKKKLKLRSAMVEVHIRKSKQTNWPLKTVSNLFKRRATKSNKHRKTHKGKRERAEGGKAPSFNIQESLQSYWNNHHSVLWESGNKTSHVTAVLSYLCRRSGMKEYNRVERKPWAFTPKTRAETSKLTWADSAKEEGSRGRRGGGGVHTAEWFQQQHAKEWKEPLAAQSHLFSSSRKREKCPEKATQRCRNTHW